MAAPSYPRTLYTGKLISWLSTTLAPVIRPISLATVYFPAAASIRYGFEEARLNRIVAVAVPENIASRRVMEKIGMKFEKTGHWYGAELVYYAIERDEYERGAAVYKLLRA